MYPEWFVELVAGVVAEHSSDIEAAVAAAMCAIRRASEDAYGALVAQLMEQAVREAVYDARHAANVRMKRDAGYYVNSAKAPPQGSKGVADAYRSVYSYHIAGTVLGELLGKDLPAVAQSEMAKADGHRFNSRLAAWLQGHVKPEQKVREAFPDRRGEMKLWREFNRIHQEVFGGGAE